MNRNPQRAAALSVKPQGREPHVRVFDMTGRPMKGWVLIAPDGVASDDDLRSWVARGLEFARSLPAK